MPGASLRSVRSRHRASSGSLLAGGLLLASLTVVLALGPGLNRPLLRAYAWLTPLRTLALAAAVAAAIVAVPAIRRGVRRAGQALASLPAVWSIAGLVLLGASLQIVRGARKHAPFVLGDELVYSDLAKSVAREGELLLRGSPHFGHSVLYPVAISPFFALAGDTASALAALGVAQALWMVLASLPAYALARRVVSHEWALAVAALTALSPWIGYAALVMTESLFFPCFLAFALALVRTLERPTLARQAGTFGLVIVLVLIRPQAVTLVPAVATAVVLYAPRAVRAYASLLIAVAALTAVAGAVLLGGIGGPGAAYNALFDDIPSPVSLALWSARNVGGLGIALGVLPLLALPPSLVGLLGARATRAERALGATTVSCFAWMTASVAVVSADPLGFGWVYERSLFFVSPLVLACVAHWLAQGAPASRWTMVLSAIALALTLGSLTEGLVAKSSDLNAPGLVPLKRLLDTYPAVPAAAWIAGASAVACALIVVARKSSAPMVAAATFAIMGSGTLVFADDLTLEQARHLGWVDAALPRGATATLLHVDFPVDPNGTCGEAAEYDQQGLVVWTEFFNERIDHVLHFGGPIGRDALDSPEVHLARRRGLLLTAEGRALGPDYVVVDSRETIAGVRLRRFEPAAAPLAWANQGSSLTLWRAEKPLRVGPRRVQVTPRADGEACQTPAARTRSSNSSSNRARAGSAATARSP